MSRQHEARLTAGELLRAALGYAAAGWPAFPCHPDNPDCQHPRGCGCKAPLTEHGFEDAATDPALIRAWWSRWPGADVAIATGRAGRRCP